MYQRVMGVNHWENSVTCMNVESVLDDEGLDLENIPFRDPNAFLAGQLGRGSSVGECYFTM